MPSQLLRNVFDQYSQPENTLTHGLVQVLARDQALTRNFVAFATGIQVPRRQRLSFTCQVLPGDSPRRIGDEQAAEKAGIPDAWIFDEHHTWALVIESKLSSQLTEDQLNRHLSTAKRCHFDKVILLAITTDDEMPIWLEEKRNHFWVSWANIYEFLSAHEHYSNPLARFLGSQFLEYLRVAEGRGMAGERTLTTFSGVPFDEEHPYNEVDARVVLRSLMKELRKSLASSHVLPIEQTFEQKPLTGTWDYIGFDFAEGADFRKHPHLTVSIGQEIALEMTLPNGALGNYWRNLIDCEDDALLEVFGAVVESVRPLRRSLGGGMIEPRVVFEVLQRHFHARKSEIKDGTMRFDLDAIIPNAGSSVKPVPGWLPAFRSVIESRRSANMQPQLTVRFPFSKQSVSHGPEFVSVATTAAEALQPFLDLIRGER